MSNYIADSSDDELMALSLDEVTTSENYRNLETFQKAQLNKKVTFRQSFVMCCSLLMDGHLTVLDSFSQFFSVLSLELV